MSWNASQKSYYSFIVMFNIFVNSGIGAVRSLPSSSTVISSSVRLIALIVNVSLLNIYSCLEFFLAITGIPVHNLTSCEFGS